MTELRRLHILVEGQAEETVVRDVIEPYLACRGWSSTWSIVKTKRPAGGGPTHKGGVTSWAQVDREIRLLLRDSSIDVLATMLDYYAFPDEAPGMATRPPGTPLERVQHVEHALVEHFGDRRLLPHLVLHETEAWVFAAGDELAELYGDVTVAQRLEADVAAADGPENVNDDPATAPSKRLATYCPSYMKTVDGPMAIASFGVGRLRQACPHVDAWLDR